MEAGKILIIDDNAGVRSLLDSLFQKAGYTVISTGDGESGLTVAEQGGFAAIILDLKMPKVNGIEFLRAIRDLKTDPQNGPVIVCTSQAEESIKQAAITAGALQVVDKTEETLLQLPSIVSQLAVSS